MTNYPPIKIAYKVFDATGGSKDDLAPVIFLHGATCSKEMWGDIPQIVANKSKRKTYAYDARNHGESEYTEQYNFDLNTDDLFQFMDERKIEKAVLVGHSMGSFTSTNSALKKPERIEMIFSEDMYIRKISKKVADSVIAFISDLSEAVQGIPNDVNESDAIEEAVKILHKNNSESFTVATKESMKKSKRILKRKSDGGYEVAFNKDAIIRAFKNPETLMTNPSGQFNGQVYFMHGADSPFSVRSQEDHIREHFPNAEFIAFKGAAHTFHLDFLDKFVETIVNRLHQ